MEDLNPKCLLQKHFFKKNYIYISLELQDNWLLFIIHLCLCLFLKIN